MDNDKLSDELYGHCSVGGTAQGLGYSRGIGNGHCKMDAGFTGLDGLPVQMHLYTDGSEDNTV